MTPRQQAAFEGLAKIAVILVPIGIAWGALRGDVQRKLDTERFVRDSSDVRYHLQALQQQNKTLQAICAATKARCPQ